MRNASNRSFRPPVFVCACLLSVLLLATTGCAGYMTPTEKVTALNEQQTKLDTQQVIYTATTQAAAVAEAAVKTATTQQAPAAIAAANAAEASAASVKKAMDATSAALVKIANTPTFDPGDPQFKAAATAIATAVASAIPGAQPALPLIPILVPSLLAIAGLWHVGTKHAANAQDANANAKQALETLHVVTTGEAPVLTVDQAQAKAASA
jgi:hypothetical protein